MEITTADKILFLALAVLIVVGIVLSGTYGCEPHDPKPKCNAVHNTNTYE